MAVNLLEEDRLVYHDNDGDTLEVFIPNNQFYGLYFDCIEPTVSVDRDAVETLRDSLTCWLETGKLK